MLGQEMPWDLFVEEVGGHVAWAGEGGSRVVGGEGPMTVARGERNMTRDVVVYQSRIAS